MSTYVIGDVQGCFEPLQQLLKKIAFDPIKDTLWFTGDLVNRGPQSLEVLRFVKALGPRHITVLGNHDLHLLAVAHHARAHRDEDNLNAILEAPDKENLLSWLIQRPLLHHDAQFGFTLVHAGLAAEWDLRIAKRLANEVEAILQSNQATDFFHHMYGNTPDQWSNELIGWDRLRCIVNYFTRVRFCHPNGSLELNAKGKINSDTSHLLPWFQIPHRKNADIKIVFGHWAALEGITNTPNVFALDTGCVWGNCLTAMRLEDQHRFSINC